jgi:hypothetical protein
MEGKALIWFQDMDQSGFLPNWETLSLRVLERFGPSAYDDPMESLTSLRQQTSVEDYKAKFEVLSNRLRDLSEGYKLSCFLSGLKEEIRLPVRMFGPKTLLAAYGLAKIQEEHVLSGRRSFKNSSWNMAGSGLPKAALPTQSFVGGPGGGVPKVTIPIQRISPAQMEDRRKKGLFYNCDAKWQFGHKCQSPKLFVIESVEVCEISTLEPVMEGPEMDSMEYTYSEEHPEISLHVITGSSHPKTMRIIGTIGGKKVIILIDSGSTHNFLDSSVVQNSRLLVNKSLM